MRLLPIRAKTTERGETSFRDILKKLGYILLGLMASAFIFEFEATLEIVEELLITGIEFLEQGIEEFFSHTVGLSHYYSQMATAWFGLVVAIILVTFIGKRLSRLVRRTREALPGWREQRREAVLGWSQRQRADLEVWWQSLTLARRIAVVVTAVIVAVPLSWGLALLFVTLLELVI
ncbi:MAG: hypothetical protein U1E83_03345 [Methylotetracoccus sp.]